jgi:hypothetical protein
VTFVLVMIAALVVAPEAAAKCCALTTPRAPDGIAAGETWTASVVLRGDRRYWRTDQPLTIIAWRDPGPRLFSAEARPTGTPGRYEAKVVFSEPGRWSYAVTVGGFAGSASAPVREVFVEEPPERREAWALVPLAAVLLAAGVGVRRARSQAD